MADNPTEEKHFVVKLAEKNSEDIVCIRAVLESLVAALGGTINWEDCTVSGVP